MGDTFRSKGQIHRSGYVCVILLISLFISFFVICWAQVKDPEFPEIPDIKDVNVEKTEKYPAEVIYNGGSFSGELSFSSDFISNDNKKGEVYYFKDISNIYFLSWVRYAKGKSYIFYPQSYRISLKNGIKVDIEGNIRQLNKFRITRNRSRRTMYSYYYDEYSGGKWINTGETDFFKPSVKPAAGCVTSINFL